MAKLTTIGSKRAVGPATLNGEILLSATKRSNFDLVAGGSCPHDSARLGKEIRCRGVGFTRVCENCGHIWYINKKIRTCKCLTCSGAKRNTTERKIANRIDNQSLQKVGGPLWTRTRDPSLIRTVL